MQKVTKAIIIDAGIASRYLPLVKSVPKTFVNIAEKPVIQMHLEELRDAGIKEAIIVARAETKDFFEEYFGNKREDIKEFLQKMGKAERYKCIEEFETFPKITVIVQPLDLPYGTASGILSAKSNIPKGEPFIVFHGDDVVYTEGEKNSQTLIREYQSDPNYMAYIMAQEYDNLSKMGVIKLKEGTTDQLDYIVEKPKIEDAPSNLVSYGRFLYKYEIFDYMDISKLGKDNELWNADVIARVAKDHPVKVIRNKGQWETTGDPFHHLKAQVMFAIKNKEYGDEFLQYLKTVVK